MCFVNEQVVYEGQELNHAFGLCHYKQFLFWNEYRGGSIYKLDQVNKTVTLLRNERPPIFEIRVYDAHQQQGMFPLLPNCLIPCKYVYYDNAPILVSVFV